MPKYLKEFLCTMPKQYRQEPLEKAGFRCLLSWHMMFVLLCTRETDTQGEPPAACCLPESIWCSKCISVANSTPQSSAADIHHDLQQPSTNLLLGLLGAPLHKQLGQASAHACGLTQSSAASPHSSNVSRNRLWEYSETR